VRIIIIKGISKNPDFIPTAASQEKISYLHINYMPRCKIFHAPYIWANSEFLEAPLSANSAIMDAAQP